MIEITFSKDGTDIRRYDCQPSTLRNYKNLTFSSSQRLDKWIKENQYKENGIFGHYQTHFCNSNPVERKHYFMLEKEYQIGTIVGTIWEINEDIYNFHLGNIPPLEYLGYGFICSSFVIDNITTKYTKSGDHYYCEFIEWSR